MFWLAAVLLLLLLTYQLVAQAQFAPNITRQEGPSSCVDCRFQRTLFNIVWGCISTTIICAWAAIHPNIPPREGPFKRTLRRLELMFWTIMAPEMLPCWALNQLLAAITVRDVYNKRKDYEKKRCGIWETVEAWFSLYQIKEAASREWTRTHGHFLIMGGFHVVEPPEDESTRIKEASTSTQRATSANAVDVPSTSALLVEETNSFTEKGHGPSENKPEPELEQGIVTILTLEMLEELVKDPGFKIQITEEEIINRSKGDALSKVILIMQSTWFILQCFGRRIQGLDLTLIELTTLGLASLNGVTFALWWDKPLGVQAIVRVYLKRKLTDLERQVPRAGNPMRSTVIPKIQETFESCVTTIRDAFVCQSERNVFVTWLIQVPFAILLLLLSPLIAFAFASYPTFNDLLRRTNSFPTTDMYVPTFYVPIHRHRKRYHILLLISLGTIFGGIHCSGWNFVFPTYAEQKLWRVASLVVTIIPIVTFPFTLIVNSIVRRHPPSFENMFYHTPAFFLCSATFVSARLVLLVLALTQLRHLPPTALVTVDWTKFYPHFF